MKNTKKFLSQILAAVLVFSLVSIPASAADGQQDATAVPIQYSLCVDGEGVSLWAYEIGGGVWFRLRDLAMALDGTGKKFDIVWIPENREVDLIEGSAYTPVGGELVKPGRAGSAAAQYTDCSIRSMSGWGNVLAYLVGGTHCVKLSDLASVLKFASSCDEENRTAQIDTTPETSVLPETGEALDNIALQSAGNSYSLGENGNVILYYKSSGTYAEAPLSLQPAGGEHGSGLSVEDAGFYLSEKKTAIAYGGSPYGTPVCVMTSEDMGKTWEKSEVIAQNVGVSKLYVGFNTENDGWLVICNFHGMGNEDHYIYQTADGGKTWTQIGNPNELYARVATGAGFSSHEIGFICYRYEFTMLKPTVCRTEDGGLTWEKIDLTLPAKFDSYYSAQALSPVFCGENGLLPVELQDNGNPVKKTVIYLTSGDYGKTWTYDEDYNLARVWAEARITGDGGPRWDIMSADMQAGFLKHQGTKNAKPGSFTIHLSGPQLDCFDISMTGGGAVVTYWYAGVYGSWYKGVERLAFGEEGGRKVVTDCKTETKFTDQKLYNEALPVITLGEDQILYAKNINGITQGFYRSEEKGEVGNEFYSYLSIGGVKYDLGYVGYDAGGGYQNVLFALTDIDSATPVYRQIKIYGLTAIETSYYTIRNNAPYLLYNMPGIGEQYDLDGDGSVETVANAGTPLFQEDFIYEWNVRAGTISLLPLTEALGCDIASYGADDNLIHTYTFLYDDTGGVSGPPAAGSSYRYAAGGLVEAGGDT
ncbi:hypothetical protein SDC9_53694 [bioreactor metagenome]|uniref:Uncharacterized protein n=1 Tax=bioreactor metagenome TaxID=1076179 RepID=A0A644WV70_9ZZZZ